MHRGARCAAATGAGIGWKRALQLEAEGLSFRALVIAAFSSCNCSCTFRDFGIYFPLLLCISVISLACSGDAKGSPNMIMPSPVVYG